LCLLLEQGEHAAATVTAFQGYVSARARAVYKIFVVNELTERAQFAAFVFGCFFHAILKRWFRVNKTAQGKKRLKPASKSKNKSYRHFRPFRDKSVRKKNSKKQTNLLTTPAIDRNITLGTRAH
jgi:hypothetical protein